MTEPESEPKPPSKFGQFVAKLLAAPGRVARWSLPARGAWAVGLFLVLLVAIAWTSFLVNPATVPWRHALTLGRILTVLSLLLVTPWVVYRTLKLWTEGEVTPFPDIDYAWNAGLLSLERHGLDINSLPIFLVLGCHDQRQEHALLDAAGLTFRIYGDPEGPGPLHWYANPEAIYLFCADACALGAWAAADAKRATTALPLSMAEPDNPIDYPAPAVATVPIPAAPAAPTLPAPQRQPEPRVAATGRRSGPSAAPSPKGTIMLSEFMAQNPEQSVVPQAAPAPAPTPATTLQPAPVATIQPARQASPAAAIESAAPARYSSEPRAAVLSRVLSVEYEERLQYLCRLLSRERHPFCGINGILTVIPFKAIDVPGREAEEIERVVRTDLAVIQRELEVRCPVTLLVGSLEQEAGFRELVRRVGRERAFVQRFGRGFDVRALPTPPELAVLCEHVCGAVEDWVYMLFRETGSLSRPGNLALYALLCKIRCTFKYRLADLLAKGFGYDPQRYPGSEPILFSGCYLAATGGSEDRQAFVKGVFEKLLEEQESLEWTAGALRADARHGWIAAGGFVVVAALALLIASMVGYRLLGG